MKKVINKAVLFFYIGLSLFRALFRKQRNNAYKRILVVDTLRLGDVIMSLPVFKAVKNKYPDSEVLVIVRAGFAEILEDNPYVDKIIPYYGKSISNLKFIKSLAKERCDVCINLCEGKLNGIIYASGIPRRIGYIQKHKRRDRFFLTDTVEWNGEFKGITSMFLRLLEPLGIFGADDKPELYPKAEDTDSIADLLPNVEGLKIIIHPGTRKLTKGWPYYRELIEKIIKQFDAFVIISGDSSEVPFINKMLDSLDNRKIVNLAGKTTLKQLAPLCSMADIVIGNDTGVLHIARAVKTPAITIFGPEDPGLAGTADALDMRLAADVGCGTDSDYFGIAMQDVKRCKKETCENHECMKDITAEMVIGSMEKILAQRRMHCSGD
ncbi:MAG: glycosyltransferase family 9 protein [Thermodesulfovibrionales bacterium]|nr:glycosyltransferase family 9 protein [Thermodesulfovibrionales bacterium]